MTAGVPGFQLSTSRPKNCALAASSSRSWKRGSGFCVVAMPRRMWPSSGLESEAAEKEISKRSFADCGKAGAERKRMMHSRKQGTDLRIKGTFKTVLRERQQDTTAPRVPGKSRSRETRGIPACAWPRKRVTPLGITAFDELARRRRAARRLV